MKRRMVLAAAVVMLAGWSDDDDGMQPGDMPADPRREGESWQQTYSRLNHAVQHDLGAPEYGDASGWRVGRRHGRR